MTQTILGISAYYNDSAAAMLSDGQLVAAAHEERFSRIKHDSSFPANSIRYVLKEAGLECDDIDCVAFYDKPFLKFERLLETYHAFAPKGFLSFSTAMPLRIKEKLFFKRMLRGDLAKIRKQKKPIFFPEHHLSHTASAFYPSPFEEVAILTVEGVGEWSTTTIAKGTGNKIEIMQELHFPHSIGLLYSAFTAYCGFRVNSGEYELMGLAPKGDKNSKQMEGFKKKISDEIVDIRKDGSILLNMDYFNYATGMKMVNENRWIKLLGLPPRLPESEIPQDYMNLALAIQQVTEEIILKLAKTARMLTQKSKLVMAGGVALNCVANSRLLKDEIFDDIWIQPAAGDADGAIGAAYADWYLVKDNDRITDGKTDMMKGAQLGPEYSEKEIILSIQKCQLIYETYDDFTRMAAIAPEKNLPDNWLNDGKCDPAGRFWFGSMDSKYNASLYRLSASGKCDKMLDSITISKGIVWSLDNTKMYYINSPTMKVRQFDYDNLTGNISNSRAVIKFPEGVGSPDGMAIDSKGKLWIAHWGGACVTFWDPNTGEMIAKVEVPAQNVTACAFGGKNLETLYITTTSLFTDEASQKKFPNRGGIFVVNTGAKGIPANYFKTK